jgi:hypothetical protein
MTITDKAEALAIFNDELELLGQPPMNANEFKDWFQTESTTYDEIKGWARDLASEAHSDRCERARAERLYEQGLRHY